MIDVIEKGILLSMLLVEIVKLVDLFIKPNFTPDFIGLVVPVIYFLIYLLSNRGFVPENLKWMLYIYLMLLCVFVNDVVLLFYLDDLQAFRLSYYSSFAVIILLQCFTGVLLGHKHILITGGVVIIRLLLITLYFATPEFRAILTYALPVHIVSTLLLFYVVKTVMTGIYKSYLDEIKTDRQFAEFRNFAEFKNQMISFFAHDIKGSLNRISLLSSKMSSDAGELVEACRQISLITNNMQNINKMEDASYRYDAQEIDISKVINNAIDNVKIFARYKNINILVGALNGQKVSGEEFLIESVITNFLSNALKYAPYETTVHVQVSSANGQLTLEVADQGPGVTGLRVEDVFKKYHHGNHNPDLTFTFSSGLGLAFCKLAIQLMHGVIGLTSVKDGGCVFWFSLPLLSEGEVAEVVVNGHNNESLLLNNIEMETVRPILETLKGLEYYETGRIMLLLDSIVTDNVNIARWKDAVLNASMLSNIKKFKSLIDNVDRN
ncbi:MAG: multi-sensor hybrid histidine kinase [Bacteroidetes bacterium]|nr:multi-sensor hybrid histidine kinase [Bacteroidota bacterium]